MTRVFPIPKWARAYGRSPVTNPFRRFHHQRGTARDILPAISVLGQEIWMTIPSAGPQSPLAGSRKLVIVAVFSGCIRARDLFSIPSCSSSKTNYMETSARRLYTWSSDATAGSRFAGETALLGYLNRLRWDQQSQIFLLCPGSLPNKLTVIPVETLGLACTVLGHSTFTAQYDL